jgi:hypothetical protein
MRKVLLLLGLLGCGGAAQDCRENAVHRYTAVRGIVSAPACADLPEQFSVTLNVESGTWAFVEEDGARFAATYVDPGDGCFGYGNLIEPAAFYHSYAVWLDGRRQSYVDVVRSSGCMARYDLR